MFRKSERGLFDNGFDGSLRVGDIRFEHVDSQRVQPRVDHLADLLPVETLSRLVLSVGFCLPVVSDGAERGAPGEKPDRVHAFLRNLSFGIARGHGGQRVSEPGLYPLFRGISPISVRFGGLDRRCCGRGDCLRLPLLRRFGPDGVGTRSIGQVTGSLGSRRYVRIAERRGRRHVVRLLSLLGCRSGVVPACRVRCSVFRWLCIVPGRVVFPDDPVSFSFHMR